MTSRGSTPTRKLLPQPVSNALPPPPLTPSGNVSRGETGQEKFALSPPVLLYLDCTLRRDQLVPHIPISWVSHFNEWAHGTTFALCYLAIAPLQKLFDWGGEQMAMYLGKDLGDLVVVTLNNAVEATLAIILLFRCEDVSSILRGGTTTEWLDTTCLNFCNPRSLVSVVLLHLLLIPGVAFFTGGARIWEQQLHPHRSQLNHTLLTVGVLALTIPAAFFAATDTNNNNGSENATAITDKVSDDFLRISRGFAVLLLVIYVGSRFYLHGPPGANNALTPRPHIPEEVLRREQELEKAEPEVNPWACLILLAITVALMGVTAVFLVDSIESVRRQVDIEEEWFGIILLPIVSFSADGTVAVTFFIRQSLKAFFNDTPQRPESLAQARAIDMSIQFLLFWMPFVTLLGWWANKPMTMLFDLFEVTLLVGACFLVNYATADAKTNWAEGSILIAFYAMIGLSAWYYLGQNEVRIMDACTSVALALVEGVDDSH
ncbi:hypothetical protein EDB85DRAFT_2143038 [Lactarius pseudohatsudake]|nr:hypothetical protein EDB85DRAFT_2143038 [Lactarius pseudohatsudake]